MARRLLISLFSAALWSPATEATKMGRMRAERMEEVIVGILVHVVDLLKEQQVGSSLGKPLILASAPDVEYASFQIGTSGPNCHTDRYAV